VTSEVLNVAVVGGGPAGISVAVECQRAGIHGVVVLEKGDTHNYMINKLYTHGKRVDAIWKGIAAEPEGALWLQPGNRETYLRTMNDFIERYQVDIRYRQEVGGIERRPDGLFHMDVCGRSMRAHTVVLAIGVMGRPNRPDYRIPRQLMPRVHFNVARGIKSQRVLIVGGGDSAAEAAQYLYPSNEVVLAYRGEDFARMNALNEKIVLELERSEEIRVWRRHDVERVEPATGALCRVKFKKRGRLEVFDHVVYCLGGSSPSGFLQAAGLRFRTDFPDVDPRNNGTDIPGLYLAGDLAQKGKGSIITAFNTGHRIVQQGLCVAHFACTPVQDPQPGLA